MLGCLFFFPFPRLGTEMGKEVERNVWTGVGEGLQPSTRSSTSLAPHRLCWNPQPHARESTCLEGLSWPHMFGLFSFCPFFSLLSSSLNFSLSSFIFFPVTFYSLFLPPCNHPVMHTTSSSLPFVFLSPSCFRLCSGWEHLTEEESGDWACHDQHLQSYSCPKGASDRHKGARWAGCPVLRALSFLCLSPLFRSNVVGIDRAWTMEWSLCSNPGSAIYWFCNLFDFSGLQFPHLCPHPWLLTLNA